MKTASASALAALAAAAWLLRLDAAWDTYHTPLFWPFLFAAGIMAVCSTTDAAAETVGIAFNVRNSFLRLGVNNFSFQPRFRSLSALSSCETAEN